MPRLTGKGLQSPQARGVVSRAVSSAASCGRLTVQAWLRQLQHCGTARQSGEAIRLLASCGVRDSPMHQASDPATDHHQQPVRLRSVVSA